jgi:putative spermidine/putrescine transport system substrate-binding protein
MKLKKLLLLATASASCLAVGLATAKAADVTFYDTMSGANFVQWWQATAIPACQEAVGGQVRYTSAGSAEVLQRIQAAGSNGDIDLLFLAPDKIAAFKAAGVLVDLRTLGIANLTKTVAPDNERAAGVDLDGVGAPFFRYTYTLIYNSDQVKNPPTSWVDLYERRDEWKGRISYVDPRSTVSGAGRFFVAMFLRAHGSDLGFENGQENATWAPAWEKLAEFEKVNAPKHAESGGAHMAQFATGEISVGFHALDFALYSRKQGTIPPAIATQLPSDGIPGGAGYLAIAANASAEGKEAAAKMIDCALSDQVQSDMVGQMFQFPGTDSAWTVLPEEAKAVLPTKEQYSEARASDPSAEALAHIQNVWAQKVGY